MLETYFHELNAAHFQGSLPLPKLSWNSRLTSTAGRFCPGSRNPLRPRDPHIEVASYLREIEEGEMHVRDTMLHEMIHYFLWFERRPHGHTGEFLAIMRKVGAKRYNTVPLQRPFKYYYGCPSCLKSIPTRRKLVVSACATCCNKFNNGKFHSKFLLQITTAPPPAQTPVVIRREAKIEEETTPRLPPSEIIRRLEELKEMIRCGTGK